MAPVRKDGKIQYFSTKQDADEEAEKLKVFMNKLGSGTSFKYTVELAKD